MVKCNDVTDKYGNRYLSGACNIKGCYQLTLYMRGLFVSGKFVDITLIPSLCSQDISGMQGTHQKNNVPELGPSKPDVANIRPIPYRFWYIMTHLQRHEFVVLREIYIYPLSDQYG